MVYEILPIMYDGGTIFENVVKIVNAFENVKNLMIFKFRPDTGTRYWKPL